MISHFQMAQKAIELAENYLRDRVLPKQRFVEGDFFINYFDYKEVLRYGIAPSQLPRRSIVLGKPISFFTKYKTYCITAFVVAVLMAVFGQILGTETIDDELTTRVVHLLKQVHQGLPHVLQQVPSHPGFAKLDDTQRKALEAAISS